MKILAVIPARYDSTRLPGKPLINILGKTMIERVYLQASQSSEIHRVIVATDDERISRVVKGFGGEVCMTSRACKSGTDRVWEVVQSTPCDAVVNVQGDEPLISPELISQVARVLKKEPELVVSAASKNRSFDDFISQHNVKVVVNHHMKALYFSRAPIPFTDRERFSFFYHHFGIYGYHKNLLRFFINQKQADLETVEKLEQLRFLENGKDIQIILTNEKSHGVDTPEDKIKVEKLLIKI